MTTTVAIGSTRASPGASSLAVGLGFAWRQLGAKPLLVEADPAGGVIGLRFDLAAEPSLVTLSADMRRGLDLGLIHHNTIDLQGVRCLLCPADPLQASRVLERNADVLARGLALPAQPTVVDLGRVWGASPALPLAEVATEVLLLVRPRVEDVQSMLFGIRLLRSRGCNVSLVLIGDRPHHPEEVASLAGVPVLGILPDDRQLAAALCGGRFKASKLRKSMLWRSVFALAEALLVRSPVAAGWYPPPPAPPPPPAQAPPAAVPLAPGQPDPRARRDTTVPEPAGAALSPAMAAALGADVLGTEQGRVPPVPERPPRPPTEFRAPPSSFSSSAGAYDQR